MLYLYPVKRSVRSVFSEKGTKFCETSDKDLEHNPSKVKTLKHQT